MHSLQRFRLFFPSFFLVGLGSIFGLAEELPLKESSIFAVVTHKGGLLKGAAHNHFVYAGEYHVRLDVDLDDPSSLEFEITLPSEGLVVDDAAVSAEWFPRLQAHGVLEEAFSEISEGNREKIRKSMLGKSQLNAKKHENISAKVLKVAPMVHDDFNYELTLAVTILGKTVEKPVFAKIEAVDGVLKLEAVGVLKFTDFGIKPYSAMLGSVSNKDEFHVYVFIEAGR